MTKLKVVCIGAGYFAKFHVEAWTRIPEVELVAICDMDLAKAQKLATEFNVKKVFASLEEVNEKLPFDILDIITPPNTHYQLCVAAAAYGKHIICQKPLAPNLIEAEQLVAKMNAAKGRFMVHENFRFLLLQITPLPKGIYQLPFFVNL